MYDKRMIQYEFKDVSININEKVSLDKFTNFMTNLKNIQKAEPLQLKKQLENDT